MVEILAAVIGFLSLALFTLLGWMLRIDRKLTTVCTAVEIRFDTVEDKFKVVEGIIDDKNKAIYKHIGEQKEACKDKFKAAHEEDNRRLGKLEGKVFNGG